MKRARLASFEHVSGVLYRDAHVLRGELCRDGIAILHDGKIPSMNQLYRLAQGQTNGKIVAIQQYRPARSFQKKANNGLKRKLAFDSKK
jgi:hypothetical protein